MSYVITKRQLKSTELFIKGLDKLSQPLRQSYLKGELFYIRKNDIKKLAKLEIPDGSIADKEQLEQLIN